MEQDLAATTDIQHLDPEMNNLPMINWHEAGEEKSARWRTERVTQPPQSIQIADDQMSADTAFRLASQGQALLWRGDFQNARQLLQAIARRIDKKPRKHNTKATMLTLAETFHRYRLAQSQRARTLNMLLIPIDADHNIPLKRAPNVQTACQEAFGSDTQPYVMSLRGLQGVIGAHEWRKKGIHIAELNSHIHPHYGVFAPIRQEYITLVAQTPLPELCTTQSTAFDIGTGTGVLAAIFARRGIQNIIATDHDERALHCARENLTRLNLIRQVELQQTNIFPAGRAALIVCNPPWIPARPSSPLEHAIFDNDGHMLKQFLSGLHKHLLPGGEGWLILSDFAEHLGLRSRTELLAMMATAGLTVLNKQDIKPQHPRISYTDDPLHKIRESEITSLWRLRVK